jgi:uncharacterized OB-fold protein
MTKECKVCNNIYCDTRTHCPVCGALNHEFTILVRARGAESVTQNLYSTLKAPKSVDRI